MKKKQTTKALLVTCITDHKQDFYRLAFSYVKNQDDTLDIVQESIKKALSSVETVRNPETIKSWFYKILVRTAIDFLRKQKKIRVMDDETIEFLSKGKEDHYKDTDLHEALDELPYRYKTIIILRFFEDFRRNCGNYRRKHEYRQNAPIQSIEADAHSADEGGSFLMDKRLQQLREEYKNVPIPKELDIIVEKALQQEPKKKRIVMWPTSAAIAAAILFTALVNINPDAAQAMSRIPVIGKIVKAITFIEIKEEKDQLSIDVKTPALSELSNKELENSINQKYLKESQQLYKEFIQSTSKNKKGHLSIYSDYETVTDTPDLLSIRRNIEKTQASSYTQSRYITIDKKNDILLTLKSLFKDERYIKVISQNIREQMKQQMKEDPNKIYWLTDEDAEPFKTILPDQTFYITEDHKLVISFDEYEVAPGYMGVTEFTIPTSVISNLLVGERYIR